MNDNMQEAVGERATLHVMSLPRPRSRRRRADDDNNKIKVGKNTDDQLVLHRCRKVALAQSRVTVALFFSTLLLVFSLNIVPTSSSAAYPLPQIHDQPDGSQILLSLKGDEHCHYLYQESDGRTVVRDLHHDDSGGDGTSSGSRWYCYAVHDRDGNLISSRLRVGIDDPNRHMIPPKLLPGCVREKKSSSVPEDDDDGEDDGEDYDDEDSSSDKDKDNDKQLFKPMGRKRRPKPSYRRGRYRLLVVPVRFADHSDRPVPTRRQLDVLYNSDKRNAELAPTGSLRTIYHEQSDTKFDLRSIIAPRWIDLPNPEAYYADEDGGRVDRIKMDELMHFVLDDLDADGDFNFDRGGRGQFIGVNIVMSGYGAEFGGTDCNTGASSTERLWSHQWQTAEWTSAKEAGVKFNKYALTSAFWGTCGYTLQKLLPIYHETLHLAGLRDLYYMNGDGYAGVGAWDVMGDAYGFDRRAQVGMLSAYSRIKLGWCQETQIKANGRYILEPTSTSCQIYRVNVGFPHKAEYLLLESRRPVGYDSTVPEEGGLAIWHIDLRRKYGAEEKHPGQAEWPAKHGKVVLLQADGDHHLQSGEVADEGDLFVQGQSLLPGDAKTPVVYPNSDSWFRGKTRSTGIRISNIRVKGDLLEFDFFSPELTDNALPCDIDMKIACTTVDQQIPCNKFRQDYSRSICNHEVEYKLTIRNSGSSDEAISSASWKINGADQETPSTKSDLRAGSTLSTKSRASISFCGNAIHHSSARVVLQKRNGQSCNAVASYAFETHDAATPLCVKTSNGEPFESGMGDCSSYSDGQINHPFCAADANEDGILAKDACPECSICTRFCNQNVRPDQFDAGFGNCESYSRDGGANNGYCDTDTNDEGNLAEDVCPECGKCFPVSA